MKLKIIMGLVAAATATSTALQAQTTIDFTTLSTGTVVTTGPGVTFSTEDSSSVFGAPTIFAGGLTNSTGAGSGRVEFLNINFTRAASAISFFYNNQGNNPFEPSGGSFYTAFNSSGTSIGTGNLSNLNGGTVTLNLTGVSSIQLSDGIAAGTWIFDVDSLTFTEIAALNYFPITGLTPNQQAVLGPINDGFTSGNGTAAFGALTTALTPLSLNPAALGQALDQLSPLAFGGFTSTTAFNNASFETEAQDNYAATRRLGAGGTFVGGNGQVDASGLTINDPSYDPGLALVHSRLLAWSPGPLNGEISDVASPVLGGMDMKDSKQMMAVTPAYSDPWNFYVRGNVILAQGFSQNDISHFNDNTESVVLGADYRVSPNFLIGLTAGYGHTDVTLDDSGSSATVDSYSPGLYASYADKGWYANFSGNYTHDAYTQSRVIGFLGQTATSAPEGNQGTANLDGGYDFHCGALTYGPLAGVQYTHLSVDGYSETGSIADLSVNGQDADSLRGPGRRTGQLCLLAFRDELHAASRCQLPA